MKDGNPLLLSDEEQAEHLIRAIFAEGGTRAKATAIYGVLDCCAKDKAAQVSARLDAPARVFGRYAREVGLAYTNTWDGFYLIVSRQEFAEALKSALRPEYHDLIDMMLTAGVIKESG